MLDVFICDLIQRPRVEDGDWEEYSDDWKRGGKWDRADEDYSSWDKKYGRSVEPLVGESSR